MSFNASAPPTHHQVMMRHTCTFTWDSAVTIYASEGETAEAVARATAETLTNDEPPDTSLERWANASGARQHDHVVTVEVLPDPEPTLTTHGAIKCPVVDCTTEFGIHLVPQRFQDGHAVVDLAFPKNEITEHLAKAHRMDAR